MKDLLMRGLGIARVSVFWAAMWAVMFAALLSVLMALHPIELTGPESPMRLSATMGWVGLVTGAIFGLSVSVIERGKRVTSIGLLQAAIIGALSGAVYPVMTGRANQVIWTCPFGAIVGVALVALAQRGEDATTVWPRWLGAVTHAIAYAPVRMLLSPAASHHVSERPVLRDERPN